MSKLEVNGKEVHGLLGAVLSIPIILITFSAIGVAFLAASLVIISPLILIVWLIVK